MAAERVTARHEGADRPHRHVVNPAALAAANRAAMAHVGQCVVCTLAYLAVQQRGTELDALGTIESATDRNRDRLYAETRILYCADGLRLVLLLGDATLGMAIFD
jgi:hypothetical protein